MLWVTPCLSYPAGEVPQRNSKDYKFVLAGNGQFVLTCSRNDTNSYDGSVPMMVLSKVDLEKQLGASQGEIEVGVAKVDALAVSYDCTTIVTLNSAGQVRYYDANNMKRIATGTLGMDQPHSLIRSIKILCNATCGIRGGGLGRKDTLIAVTFFGYHWGISLWYAVEGEGDSKFVAFKERSSHPSPHYTSITYVEEGTALVTKIGDNFTGISVKTGKPMFMFKGYGYLLNWDGHGRFSSYTFTKGLLRIRFFKVVPSTTGKEGETMVVYDRERPAVSLDHLVGDTVLCCGWTPSIDLTMIKVVTRAGILNLRHLSPTIPSVDLANCQPNTVLLRGRRLLIHSFYGRPVCSTFHNRRKVVRVNGSLLRWTTRDQGTGEGDGKREEEK